MPFVADQAHRGTGQLLREHPLDTVGRMPRAGRLLKSWSIRPGACFRMVNDHNGQAGHCRQVVESKGVWRDPTGKSHYIETCREHAPKVRQKL